MDRWMERKAEGTPREGRILVVDDAVQNVELLEAHLAAAGYNVVKAYSGEEALRQVREEAPDLILLDLMMPGLDGYEVCHQLKADEETAPIPIMIMTTLEEPGERIRAIGVGADDFLTKPFTKLELMIRVRSLLRLKRLHDQVEAYSRMATLGEMVSGIAHELRNPLAITSLAAQILLEKGADPELRRECTERIRLSVNRTAAIIEALLNSSRPSWRGFNGQCSRFNACGSHPHPPP